MEEEVNWSDLPKELWRTIGKCLDNRIDVVRFRSVCKVWRSSISPFQQPLPPQAVFLESTVYRMKSIAGNTPNSSKPWLVKFGRSNFDHLRLLHPINNKPLRYSPTSRNFNLLDFGIVELHKTYSLDSGNMVNDHFNHTLVNRVVVMDSDSTHFDDSAVFVIYNGGNLWCSRFGDEKWTHVDEQNSHYDDLIVYKGQCYVVDRWGTISWVNSEFKLIQFSPPLCGFGGQKHLVESSGDLYVVDRYLDKPRFRVTGIPAYHVENDDLGIGPLYETRYIPSDSEAIDFKVYKLDQEYGTWVDVKSLGDQVFILGNKESFSVSAKDFGMVEGNCIWFADQIRARLPVDGRSRSCHSRVFGLKDGRISYLVTSCGFSPILWPPSTWLSPD